MERRYSATSRKRPLTSEIEIGHQAYVITAVTNAAAFMECIVNEVLQDVADEYSYHIGVLSEAVRLRLSGYWVAGDRSSTLDKYDHVLKLAGHAAMDRGADPAQSAALLVALRNYLVHYKPENVGTSLEPPKLAKRLRGRFADNELMADARRPWFPNYALSAGCATWAHETARAFVDNWTSLMGLVDLPYQSSNEGPS
jgi:hypothetical protein